MPGPSFPSSPPPGPQSPKGGGCLIAAGLLLGPMVGVAIGQVSAGLVVGGLLGVAAALLLLLLDRQR